MKDLLLRNKLAFTAAVVAIAGASSIEKPKKVCAQTFGDEGCSQSAPDESHGSVELENFVGGPDSTGVVWNAGEAAVEITSTPGNLAALNFTINGQLQCPAVGDFDEDGFEDLVAGMLTSGGGRSNSMALFRNQTGDMTSCPGADCDEDGVNRYFDFALGGYVPALPPDKWRRPKFVHMTTLYDTGPQLTGGKQLANNSNHCQAAAGDFDNDGHLDAIVFRREATSVQATSESRIYFGNGDGTFRFGTGWRNDGGVNRWTNLLAPGSVNSELGCYDGTSPAVKSYDYDGDGWLDIIYGSKRRCEGSGNRGKIKVAINNCPDVFVAAGTKCSVDPKFVPQEIYSIPNNNTIFTSASTNQFGPDGIEIGDVTNDGIEDLLISSKKSPETVLFPGIPGVPRWDFNNPLQLVAPGEMAGYAMADFNLDGKLDLLGGTEGFVSLKTGECVEVDADSDGKPESSFCAPAPHKKYHGHYTYVFNNTGNANPFDEGWLQQADLSGAVTASGSLTTNGCINASCNGGSNFFDWDVIEAFDYDRDTLRTPDAIVSDANNNGGLWELFANRATTAEFAPCGTVTSGELDLGPIAGVEAAVTAAQITPTPTASTWPGDSSITFEASNDGGANWHTMTDCDGGTIGDDWCVTFPNAADRRVRWRAQLCSTSDRLQTPKLTGVDASFDYALAETHFRAGVVVANGVAYAGAFRQPANVGKFIVANAGLDTTYFEGGAKIDAMSDADRNIYIATSGGSAAQELVLANATDADLQTALGVSGNQTEAERLITWFRSARFGLNNPPFSNMTKLGSVHNSTAAIMTPPVKPVWYNDATAAEKTALDAYITANSGRPTLAMFGSMDGMLHAFQMDIGAGTADGEEVWAFVPNITGRTSQADEAKMAAGAYPDNFPDGSPTIEDVIFADGTVHTVLISGMGSGGRTVYALDVTNTVDASGNILTPPAPLWEVYPGGTGDAGAGFAQPKPVVARVNIGGSTKFAAILGSGAQSGFANRGRKIFAYDVETGALMWKFEAAEGCYISTDIAAYETDDLLEPGGPTKDGYVDFLIAGDDCGNIYKINPNVSTGDWIESSPGKMGIGSIDTLIPGTPDTASVTDSKEIVALFSTRETPGAIGGQRPLTGTIGAAEDQTGRLVLFFGTGGQENFDVSLPNEFYAVYADNGQIRDKLVGACDTSVSPQRCEKFYGGVVVTEQQVLTTRAIDPEVGTATCDVGSAVLEGFSIDDLTIATFTTTIAGATVSGLFGDAGAVYLTTLGGQLISVGDSTAPNAGDGGFVGSGQSSTGGGGAPYGPGSVLSNVGWRQNH